MSREVNSQDKWIKYTLKKLSRADSEPKAQRHMNTVPCRWEGKNNLFQLHWPTVQKLCHNYGLINLTGRVGAQGRALVREERSWCWQWGSQNANNIWLSFLCYSFISCSDGKKDTGKSKEQKEVLRSQWCRGPRREDWKAVTGKAVSHTPRPTPN